MEKIFKPRKIVAAISIAIAVAFCIILLSLNRVSKKSIEQIATATLGTQTTIEKMNVGLLDGRVEINNLVVKNPEGFATPYFIKIKQLELAIRPTSLLGDTIEVKRFEINRFNVNFEQNFLKNNLLIVIKNLQSSTQKRGRTPEPERGKKLRIIFDRIAVNDVVVDLTFSLLDTEAKNWEVKIPNLELNDFSADEVEEMPIGEFIRKLVMRILVEIVAEGHRDIPIELPETSTSLLLQDRSSAKDLAVSDRARFDRAENGFKMAIELKLQKV